MKTIFLLFLIFLLSFISNAQVPNPTLQQGEYWTKLFSASYDFQSNGSIRYIGQDPSNPSRLCAILMAQEDSTTGLGTGRYIYYSYSSDQGKNWTKGVVDNSTNYGFPCISIWNGVPVIACHTSASTGQRTHVFRDNIFGGASYTEITGIPATTSIQWPHLASLSNGNLLLVGSASPGFQSYNTIYNGSSWTPLVEFTNTGGPSGQVSVESNSSGSVYVFGLDYNSPSISSTQLWTSSNNGLNFTLQSGSNAPPSFLLSGTDTLVAYVDGGRSGIYVGNEPHLVYCVYSTFSEIVPSPPNTNWYKKSKIIHWSPSTGVDTVAGRYNMPAMTDTLTQVLMTPVCQPSMGYYNGYIYVVYTAFLRGNKQTVMDGSQVNAGEIFLTRSSDNGNTWSTPVNLTNTPFIEEKHPSVIRNFTLPANDSAGVFYLRDMLAGGYVNVPVWGKAPVYGIYKKVSSTVLGIKEDLGIVKEYKLFQNYPNPFNPTTTISYNLQKTSFVELKIFNVLGEEVRVLINEEQTKGTKEIQFDAGSLPSGVYFYTLTAGDFKDSKPMVIVK